MEPTDTERLRALRLCAGGWDHEPDEAVRRYWNQHSDEDKAAMIRNLRAHDAKAESEK